MSDLQDAIDRRDEIIDLSPWADDNALILAGARLVANPNIEAALLVYAEASEDHADEVAYVQAIVAAAHTPGETTDE